MPTAVSAPLDHPSSTNRLPPRDVRVPEHTPGVTDSESNSGPRAVVRGEIPLSSVLSDFHSGEFQLSSLRLNPMGENSCHHCHLTHNTSLTEFIPPLRWCSP